MLLSLFTIRKNIKQQRIAFTRFLTLSQLKYKTIILVKVGADSGNTHVGATNNLERTASGCASPCKDVAAAASALLFRKNYYLFGVFLQDG